MCLSLDLIGGWVGDRYEDEHRVRRLGLVVGLARAGVGTTTALEQDFSLDSLCMCLNLLYLVGR